MSAASHTPAPRAPRERLTAPGAIDHHVADLTATASAGVTLQQYQNRLMESGQWFPIDGHPNATLGALIEQNSTGPLRLGYGAWRDLLLGVQFENGKGELVTAGGRTVKNVAGYDLTKFMIGQAGVFGKVVTLTTRTYRKPDNAILARFAPNPRLINRLMPSDCRPQWALLTKDALLCGYLSDQRTIDFYHGAVKEFRPVEVQRRTVADDIEHRTSLWRGEGEMTFRASVPPMRVQDFAQAASLQTWAADAAFGIVIGACSKQDINPLRKVATDLGGSITFRNGDGAIADLSSESGEHKILERLKHAFDPERRLASLPTLACQT